ncbi:hypothetical protein M3936_22915 [Sutcliffiella horikoshii]|uniref:hypothetical protein n=1 Tax=Sutcliffiella horikoshii TaxID=79883 RepID=UPI00203C1CD3|nr:hypothetical protein [Sutcliffiella horikoshii]MCM3620410.1 hypothetical protein [Sutcliffiella horikoshii]
MEFKATLTSSTFSYSIATVFKVSETSKTPFDFGVFFQMKKPVERAFCQKVLFTLYHDITLLIQEQKE